MAGILSQQLKSQAVEEQGDVTAAPFVLPQHEHVPALALFKPASVLYEMDERGRDEADLSNEMWAIVESVCPGGVAVPGEAADRTAQIVMEVEADAVMPVVDSELVSQLIRQQSVARSQRRLSQRYPSSQLREGAGGQRGEAGAGEEEIDGAVTATPQSQEVLDVFALFEAEDALEKVWDGDDEEEEAQAGSGPAGGDPMKERVWELHVDSEMKHAQDILACTQGASGQHVTGRDDVLASTDDEVFDDEQDGRDRNGAKERCKGGGELEDSFDEGETEGTVFSAWMMSSAEGEDEADVGGGGTNYQSTVTGGVSGRDVEMFVAFSQLDGDGAGSDVDQDKSNASCMQKEEAGSDRGTRPASAGLVHWSAVDHEQSEVGGSHKRDRSQRSRDKAAADAARLMAKACSLKQPKSDVRRGAGLMRRVGFNTRGLQVVQGDEASMMCQATGSDVRRVSFGDTNAVTRPSKRERETGAMEEDGVQSEHTEEPAEKGQVQPCKMSRAVVARAGVGGAGRVLSLSMSPFTEEAAMHQEVGMGPETSAGTRVEVQSRHDLSLVSFSPIPMPCGKGSSSSPLVEEQSSLDYVPSSVPEENCPEGKALD